LKNDLGGKLAELKSTVEAIKNSKQLSDAVSAKKPPPKKSLWRAYFCWLFGGIFGLHHLYLGHDRQAFIYWSTLGGYFLVGWTSDLFRMPELVRDANDDPKFIERFKQNIRKNQKPPFSTNKFLAQIMISYLWCQVFLIAIPEEEFFGINFSYLHWLIPLVAALGVWNVGNVGRQRGTIGKCLLAAYVVYPIRYVIYEESYWLSIVIVASTLAFENYSKEWRLTPRKQRGKIRRLFSLSLACSLYLLLLGSYFYFNAKITDSEGDEVPVHEAVSNFFKSAFWNDLKRSLIEVWNSFKHHGQMIDMIDADGEQNAFKTLGLPPTATQSEITSAFRRLSKENHPDKVKGEVEKRKAQEKFMEISNAYEVLSKIKSKRKRKNKRSTKHEDEI
ncbi:DnaJ like subfamily C member 22, partial [Pseudolycoriella hygida]